MWIAWPQLQWIVWSGFTKLYDSFDTLKSEQNDDIMQMTLSNTFFWMEV